MGIYKITTASDKLTLGNCSNGENRAVGYFARVRIKVEYSKTQGMEAMASSRSSSITASKEVANAE